MQNDDDDFDDDDLELGDMEAHEAEGLFWLLLEREEAEEDSACIPADDD